MLKRFLYSFFLIPILCFATPSQIVIVRHGDKLLQSNTGPTLSAKGEIRAVNLSFYYLKKFGEPDYIFASHPAKDSSSLREIQTVAPLANILQARYPKHEVDIMHPYKSSEYPKLAKDILNNPDYTDKKILICWSHGKIPALAQKLGVKDKLAKWPSDDFDSVYVLRYNNKGELTDYEILHEQYPVKFNGTWQDIQSMLSSRS